jgi:NhaA family Na+:H+ antiporter
MAVSGKKSARSPLLPRGPIDALAEPLVHFLNIQATSGVVLLVVTVAAVVLANSPAKATFLGFWQTPVAITWGDQSLELSLLHWINDGLMVIFFFVVGLEIKRELVHGELREFRKATLPIAGALGGMVAPAAVYLWLQWGQPGARGWGIPMATDIAFVVGCMALFGKRIPHGLRILMLTLAIVDDVGAILVIAIGYTRHVDLTALAMAGATMGAVLVAARVGIRSILVYVVLGVVLWFFFHASGVHATIGGVILGLMTPARAYLGDGRMAQFLERAAEILHGDWEEEEERVADVQHLRRAVRETLPPSAYLQGTLHPWVAYGIMPLFALANAGVPFSVDAVGSGVAVAVIAGLVVGKPLGIVLACWLSVRAGLSRLPEGVNWPTLLGGACLGGIGFTMALFLANLALDGPLLEAAKVGVLCGSTVSGAAGILLLAFVGRTAPRR